MHTSITNHFIVTFLCFILPFTVSPSSVSSDSHALLSLKTHFQRPNPSLTTWDPSKSSSFCTWVGVKCLYERVISLDLTNFNLGGSVSPSLNSLDKLIHLSLAGNNFTGEVNFISNLTNLSFLNLSNNLFNGGLDLDYSTLPNLQVLDVYDNNFTSYLPLGLASLSPTLRHLELGGNYFYGEIPVSYGDLVNLEYLSLSGNDLVGKIPKELGNLTKLRELYLGYSNSYQGGIPKELGNLVSLVILDLSTSRLEGTIPKELGKLKLLETFYLFINQLSGPIPRELGNLTNLVNFDVSLNILTGEIPAEFVNLKRLKLLNLFGNRLHGSIPDFVADFPDLNKLALWENNFTSTIPTNLGQNGKLQMVDLSSNKLTGTIPPSLCASNQLKILILMNNFLFGAIPDSLGACLSLTKVRLGHNFLNGSIPNGLIYLPQLNFLEMNNNYLCGSLVENDWKNHTSLAPTKLNHLDLSNNLLTGHLPNSISNFTSIQFLILGENQFSGPIPSSIGQLEQLIKLDLTKNNLSGSIPPQIANSSHLTYLDLSQNNISGPIPPEISILRIMNYMNLSHNQLSGTLPLSIGSMKSLTNADFSYNELSGQVPDSGQFLVFNTTSFEGNPLLCVPGLNSPCSTGMVRGHVEKSKGDFKLILALVLLVCSLFFAVAAVMKAKSFKRGSDSWKMTTFQKVDLTVADILECMKDGNVIGRGGAGIVYHGKMSCGREIAVKKLLGFGPNSHDHGFKAEIETLGNIRHRNIVRLLAFCSNKHTKLLVYEYMRNGSLGEALHGKKLGGLLGWSLRYKIALEAAKGLCYLHHDCYPLIVHRDVKSNNILLDSNFEAHVADFGLAKYLDAAASQCMSAVAGSYGYIAPEYAYTLRVDEKSDVYSFGVVLLELLTGRRPVGDFGEGVDVVQWTRQQTNCRKENVALVVDSRLLTVPQDEAMHLFFIAMLCTQDNSVERPKMREVVQMLSEYPYHDMSCQPSSSSSSLVKQKSNNCCNNYCKNSHKDCSKASDLGV